MAEPEQQKHAHEKALDGIAEIEREAKGRGTWDGKHHYQSRKYFGGWTPPNAIQSGRKKQESSQHG